VGEAEAARPPVSTNPGWCEPVSPRNLLFEMACTMLAIISVTFTDLEIGLISNSLHYGHWTDCFIMNHGERLDESCVATFQGSSGARLHNEQMAGLMPTT